MRLAGNVVTTGMVVFAWVDEGITSGESSDDSSSKNSTSGVRNDGLATLREQLSVEIGIKFELEAQQVPKRSQLSADPSERPTSCRSFLQEQCDCSARDRHGSDTRQIYVVAE